jgi:hypothetical protein
LRDQRVQFFALQKSDVQWAREILLCTSYPSFLFR